MIPLKVKASAGRDAVGREHDGALRVSVCAAPEKGKANKAVLEALADALGLAKSEIRLVAGETSPKKSVWVPLDAASVAARLGRR